MKLQIVKLEKTHESPGLQGDQTSSPALQAYVKTLDKPVLPFDAAALADGSYMDQYNAFYDSLSQ